ncbi:DNA-binding protein WhiA [Spiroplasma turonicum]|uniref:Probable cell division protein WhiA n=1 Tax=Spiroplasma turonicum TaxID=216946 RepID=A0A0K1P573_9MOLU|nr:DNA-binding protein WhiA [Spiroplasma turonicum]AKU79314.1 hypothetical protein STURON_0068 [Spiroplasma turonicum]ALX70337.1 hypothetical protein STURO_v1c00680 [Spiroplasma turonicum]
MSFALEVKNEILSLNFSKKQMHMLLVGFLKFNGEILYNNNEVLFQISSSNNSLIRGIFKILKNFYLDDFQTAVIELPKNSSNKKLYRILLTKNVKQFLTENNIFDFNKNHKIIEIPYFNIFNTFELHQDLIRAYISGVFIAVGSVNSPDTSNYHLELQFKTIDEANYFTKIMSFYKFDFRIVSRRKNYVAYIKKSMLVSDFLKFIDASESVMNFENSRINRDLKNNLNRYMNIELYNQKNSIITGSRQIKEITFIKEQGAFNLLSEKARTLADLRLENPDVSFSELVELLEERNIKISKSGVSNLFKNISKISQQLKEG